MTKDVQLLLKACNMAFRSENAQQYSVARTELKVACRRRIEGHFDNSDPQRAWQGIWHITNQNNNINLPTSNIAALAEELNLFFGCNEGETVEPFRALAPAVNNQALILQTAEVQHKLGNILGRVLIDCAVELAEVFTDILITSLLQCSVPTCLKT